MKTYRVHIHDQLDQGRWLAQADFPRHPSREQIEETLAVVFATPGRYEVRINVVRGNSEYHLYGWLQGEPAPAKTCETCGCKLGQTVKTLVDRSLGFTALLELYPGFGRMTDDDGAKITTAFLDDWYLSGHTDMYAYAREWVEVGVPAAEQERKAAVARVEARGRAEAAAGETGLDEYVDSREITEHISPPEPGTPGHEPVLPGSPTGRLPHPEGSVREPPLQVLAPDSSEARETFCSVCGHLDTPGVHLFAECPRYVPHG